MKSRRVATFFLALVISSGWLIPSVTRDSIAYGQTLGQGYSVAGDFKGAGYQQIATLYDPNDNLGLRIVVLDRTTTDPKMVSTQWFLEAANSFDLGRMKVAALDLNADGKTDIAVLYNDGNNAVRLVEWVSTGSAFTYLGTVWRHPNFEHWTSPPGFFDITKARFVAGDVDGDKRSDIIDFYDYPDGSSRMHLMLAADGHALRDVIGVAWPIGAMPWLPTQIVAGDWNKDGKSDVATLTAGQDGVTHVGLLTSLGRALQFAPDAWTTPPAEVRALGCVSCWPLNGMPLLAGQPNPHRRPLAVKIDNAPAARPHYGISQADMVWELLVEGFITRLATYYHSQDPQTIGAVRSVRFSDRYTTPMVRGSLVFSGASQLMEGLVRGDIASGLYVGVSPQLGQGNAFYRTNVDGKVAPHNLFTSSAALRAATSEVGGGGPVDVPSWDFLAPGAHAATVGGFLGSIGASTLTIPYRADARVRYDYDANANIYLRYQSNGARDVLEVDAANGAWIMAKNIVIIRTDVVVTNVIDDAGGAPSLDMRMTGSGPATIFRDGLRQDGTWSRANLVDAFTFTNQYGHKMYLSPGQTWVHVLPMDWQVYSN